MPISITGGTYSVNGGAYTSNAGTVSNGNTVAVQVTSSGSYSTTTDATLTIGGVSDTFSVTTLDDTTPDSFTFTDQTGVALSTVITSDTITVSGITTAVPISITGGTYSINGGAYTSNAGTVSNGNTVTVRMTSSANYSTTTNATLTIGGVSDTFSVTTLDDTTSDSFTFTDQTDVALSTVITSNTITVSGFIIALPISITGGTYSVNGGAYSSNAGTVSNGNTVTVQVTSSPSYSTMTNTTLTIGGVSDTFSVTTQEPTEPIIQVTPGSLTFGYVPVGSTKDLTLTVKNAGVGTLTGNATTAAPFSIVSGGSYSLEAGDDSQVVTVQYKPTSSGKHTGIVSFTGGKGVTIPLTGKNEKSQGLPWLQLLLGD